MDLPVNLELLKNPYNWAIVWLMLGMAVLGLTFLQPYLGFDTTEG